MKVIFTNNTTVLNKPTVYAIGNFDGVHKGHQKIINIAKQIAKNNNINWGVITFSPNTKQFFNNKYKFLNSTEQKLTNLEKLKVPTVIVLDFKQINTLTAEQFAQNILANISAKAIVAGSNFIFGSNKFSLNKLSCSKTPMLIESNQQVTNYSIKLCDYNLKAYIINVNVDHDISSSKIKALIENGKIQQANNALGYFFTITGEVIKGNQLGRELGFPTANFLIPSYVQPKYGVYATRVTLPNNVIKHSVSSFGIRPTIKESTKQPIWETFIFDFNQDIYGKIISVEIIDFIREEECFNGLEELKKAINNDISIAKNIFNKLER